VKVTAPVNVAGVGYANVIAIEQLAPGARIWGQSFDTIVKPVPLSETLFNGSDPWVVFVSTTLCGALVVPYRGVKAKEEVRETPCRKLLA